MVFLDFIIDILIEFPIFSTRRENFIYFLQRGVKLPLHIFLVLNNILTVTLIK